MKALQNANCKLQNENRQKAALSLFNLTFAICNSQCHYNLGAASPCPGGRGLRPVWVLKLWR